MNRYILIVICLSFTFLKSNAFIVQGIALLSSASDHSGITVNFIPKSPSAVAASGVNLVNGSFFITVVAGLYDIKYSKTGYQELLFVDQFINTDLTLNQVVLSSKPVVHVSGNVEGNWLNTNTYMVDGNISVPSGKVLIIQAGTTIQFSGFYQLDISGKLTAIGTEEERIVFTTNKTNKARGDWAGIFVRTTTDTTRFKYCVIEYAASKNAETAIINNTGNLRIGESIIKGSPYGGILNGNNGYLKVERSELTDFYFYGIATTLTSKDAVIVGNRIHHVDLIGLSIRIASLIRGNAVYNTGYNGIQINEGSSLVESNILFNNPHGVFVGGGKPTIRNNTIYQNSHGIGFYDADFWHPSAIITSNIIFQNAGYGIYSQGIYGPEKVEYNLISENPGGIANRPPVGLGVKVTTNANGHQADTYLNIFDPPVFFSTDNANEYFLNLMPTSAAIDAGDPQFKDQDNSIVDCGAISFQGKGQEITFGELPMKTFGDADFSISAIASSGLPVTFTSSNKGVAVVEGSTVKIVGGGVTSIIASQGGHPTYKVAPNVSRELVVNRKDQTITFPAISAKTFGDMPFTATGTSSSGLTVQYTSASDKVSISGNQVTLMKPGSVSINAEQSGNSNFAAAPSVSQTFCINPAKPTITASELNSDSPKLTSNSSTGNQWFRNGELITDAVSNSYSATQAGSYTVKVTADNCASEFSAEQILVITGDASLLLNTGFFVYPNPVTSTLTVNLTAFDTSSEVNIVIYDALGKMIEALSRRGEKATLSVGSYASGTYFIKASQPNQSHVAKFSKE